MTREEAQQIRKKPEEIEAWVNIKGVIFPLTLYGNIREEKPFFRQGYVGEYIRNLFPEKCKYESARNLQGI